MVHPSHDRWSLRRSLAFLAATFAVMFGALTPAAVAASPALGAPVMLCSGHRVLIAYDDEGRPTPVEDEDLSSLTCAMALMSGLAAVPSPAPPAEPVLIEKPQAPATVVATRTPRVASRPAPRPPSTAPPLS